MPATKTSEYLFSRFNLVLVDYDIDDALNVVDLGRPQGAGNKCISIANLDHFGAVLFRSVGTGSVAEFQIIAATAADGTGATIVKEHAIGSAPNAVGDTIYLEVDMEQVREVLSAATHVGIRVQLATAGDECVIAYLADNRFQRASLQSDYIS